MRRGTFSSSLLFAAIAGLATVVYLSIGASPGAGAILLAVSYLVAIAPTTSRALRIGVLAGLLGLGVGLLVPGTEARLVAAAFLGGLLRSGFLYRSRPLRGLAIETFLLTTGLALAAVLNGYGPLSTALAVWGFFLVQSLYFLVGGIELRVAAPEGLDPFVKAREEAMRLMDG
jgi:hypothetical protein